MGPSLLSIAKKMSNEQDCPVGHLIGYDCAGALKPKKVVAGEDHDLFAVKTKLGWCIVGPTAPLNSTGNKTGCCHQISSKEILPITPTSIIRVLEMDFLDRNSQEKKVLQEKRNFLQILNREILHNNKGHLEMPNSKTSWASQKQFIKIKKQKNTHTHIHTKHKNNYKHTQTPFHSPL